MENKNRITENLQDAIDTEHTVSFCFEYIASLIKNGRVRNKFCSFSELAKRNKDTLMECLKRQGVNNFVLEHKCKFCKLRPESFSLVGALNLGLEVVGASIKFYNDLLDLSYSDEDKTLFKRLKKEKIEQRVFLKKESRFVQEKKSASDLITNYCIPEVISKLWK